MSTYIIGDIHGQYETFMKLLDKINFELGYDMLIQIGDVIDRGPDGVKILQWFMEHKDQNVMMLMGNHELMMLEYFASKMEKKDTLSYLKQWLRNGGKTTLEGLQAAGAEEASKVLQYVQELPTAIDIEVDDESTGETRKYHLVHGWYSESKDMYDRVWERPLPNQESPIDDATLIVGHTPTYCLFPGGCGVAYTMDKLKELHNDGDHLSIYHGPDDKWFDIDCGCGHENDVDYPVTRLAALKIETEEEYYV